MEPAFCEIGYALLYFTSDKRTFIYDTSDIHGWNEEEYEVLKKCGKLVLNADYDYVTYRVSFFCKLFLFNNEMK